MAGSSFLFSQSKLRCSTFRPTFLGCIAAMEVLLAHREPGTYKGRFTSVLHQDSDHIAGRGPLLPLPCGIRGASIKTGTKNELRKYISLPCCAGTEEFCPRVRAWKQKRFLLLALRPNKSVKTLRMKVQVVYYFFFPSKNMFPFFHRKETRAISFHRCAFFWRKKKEKKKNSRLEFSLKLASPFHSFVIQTTFALSLSSAVSRRQQNKVIVDIDHGYVEGGHFVDAEGLMHPWVQLLDLQLPFHPLHRVEGGRLMLLSHQQTCLEERLQSEIHFEAGACVSDDGVGVYLHAVVFIVHVLDPGNELTSVEAISDRFVFITLRKKKKKS